jgi:cell wall-active antibiotic response 4TMS protein YvqF
VKADPVSLVAGAVLTVLGTLLLLDTLDVLSLRFDYAAPAVLAAVGAVLVTAGLTRD